MVLACHDATSRFESSRGAVLASRTLGNSQQNFTRAAERFSHSFRDTYIFTELLDRLLAVRALLTIAIRVSDVPWVTEVVTALGGALALIALAHYRSTQ